MEYFLCHLFNLSPLNSELMRIFARRNIQAENWGKPPLKLRSKPPTRANHYQSNNKCDWVLRGASHYHFDLPRWRVCGPFSIPLGSTVKMLRTLVRWWFSILEPCALCNAGLSASWHDCLGPFLVARLARQAWGTTSWVWHYSVIFRWYSNNATVQWGASQLWLIYARSSLLLVFFDIRRQQVQYL